MPAYRSRVGVIIGSARAPRLPHYVRVVNNTILTGAPRRDGYAGSIRMSALYTGLPRRMRPVLVNNIIGLLHTWPVCRAEGLSISNVILRGVGCSTSNRVGPANLDARGRPTASSISVIDRANRHYAPAIDVTGYRRGRRPDIGAYEYRGH